jgi:putative ABC transport system permease protein
MMRIPLKYNIQNLLVRKVTTGMTILGIALVVATFIALMAMADGLARTMTSSGKPENAVVMRKGAISDATSSVTIEQYMVVRDQSQLAQGEHKVSLASPELVFQILREKKGGGTANIMMRGTRPVAWSVHDQVRMISGRGIRVRAGEVVVGQGVHERYKGMNVGDKLALFNREWTIVGVLGASGGYYESEMWCDLDDLMSSAHRSYFSAVFVKLKSPAEQGAFEQAVSSDPRMGLAASSEVSYFEEQSEAAHRLQALGMVVAVILGLGAIFAAMNTMYAAISSRTKEIGTLRALGCSRSSVVLSFVLEAMIMTAIAGVLGCILALPVNGSRGSTINLRSFADVSFSFVISGRILLQAQAFSLLIGLLGGYLPARMGARVPIVEALRHV